MNLVGVCLALKLRKKTLAILALTFASLIVVQYAASQLVFLDSFATLEEQDTIQNIERVRSALIADLNNLDAFVYDWAAWDDTYDFIQDGNEEYVESNLVDETFIGSELNLMLYVDSSGEVVYGKAFDLENEEEMPIPETIQEHLSLEKELLQHNDTDSTVKGFLVLPEGPMLVVSRPIIKSNDDGPILGSLIMGFYFDSSRIDNLSETTHLALNIQQIDDPQKSNDFQEAISYFSEDQSIYVKPITSNSIAGYTLLEDIYGQPCLALEVTLPRSIYQQGNSSIAYFVILLLSTGITFSAVVILFLEKTILSRLDQLSTSVKNIKQTQANSSKKALVSGKDDEITDLADEINVMLATVEKAQNKLQMTNEKLSVVGKFTRHDVRNKLTVIGNNVYLAKIKLETDVPSAMEHLNNIESTIDQVTQIFEFAKTYEKLGIEELEYLDFEKIVQEVTMLQGLNGVKFVNDGKGLTLLADSLLRQIFYNLIDDTVKHSEKANQIRVYYKDEGYQLKLVYEDNGIGIQEAEKELIFTEGYGKGTGYGLYLIRKICDAYGWAIKETGKASEGAQFVITIPKINKNGKINYYTKQGKYNEPCQII